MGACMGLEQILEPLGEVDPCGPDLDEIGDDEYLGYMLPAEDRLPSRFFDSDTGAPFDRASIDLKSELAAISSLLKRSRDLRLLALEARFHILAGQIVGFCDSIRAMAGLIERYWQAVNPRAYDGDYAMRVNTIGALDDRTTIILPLQHAAIVRDRRIGPVTQRQHAVATGKVQPRNGESAPDASALLDALRSVDNREACAGVHAALTGARDSLAVIRSRFIDEIGYEQAPHFDGLNEAVADIVAMIEEALPELGGHAGHPPVADNDELPPAGGDAGIQPAEAVAAGPAAAQLAGAAAAAMRVDSHAAATAALFAAEQYFGRREPSTPALVLVHQARMLIGQPLVAAIEALMPESAERMLIRFDSAIKFQLDMNRLRVLTDSVTGGNVEAPQVEADAGGYAANTRAEAAALIAAVEAYYRTAEPSSPVPMLLGKARGYLSRDFLAILSDLIEKDR